VPDPNFVRINDVPYSWHSLRFSIEGDPTWIGGLVAIDYGRKREGKTVYAGGAAGRPKGRTTGKVSYSAKLKYLADSGAALEAFLATLGEGSIGDFPFTWILQYVEPVVPPSLPIVVTGAGCRIIEPKASHVEGIDEAVIEYDLSVTDDILLNGLPLWSVVREASDVV
jgi:hypothetical protein